MPPRTAQELIDQVIRENRHSEMLCYVFATAFVSVGVFAIGSAIYFQQGTVAVAGSVPSALFWPAINIAVKIRRENIAIRLFELPLSRFDTAKEAAEMLREFFTEEFGRTKRKKTPPKPKKP